MKRAAFGFVLLLVLPLCARAAERFSERFFDQDVLGAAVADVSHMGLEELLEFRNVVADCDTYLFSEEKSQRALCLRSALAYQLRFSRGRPLDDLIRVTTTVGEFVAVLDRSAAPADRKKIADLLARSVDVFSGLTDATNARFRFLGAPDQ